MRLASQFRVVRQILRVVQVALVNRFDSGVTRQRPGCGAKRVGLHAQGDRPDRIKRGQRDHARFVVGLLKVIRLGPGHDTGKEFVLDKRKRGDERIVVLGESEFRARQVGVGPRRIGRRGFELRPERPPAPRAQDREQANAQERRKRGEHLSQGSAGAGMYEIRVHFSRVVRGSPRRVARHKRREASMSVEACPPAYRRSSST